MTALTLAYCPVPKGVLQLQYTLVNVDETGPKYTTVTFIDGTTSVVYTHDIVPLIPSANACIPIQNNEVPAIPDATTNGTL